ncbi:hypothetical protein G3I15_02060, partial [Streptomyces sp. SID10244]|nr:hypothetical protein [Streptomyces sp. SID10244]
HGRPGRGLTPDELHMLVALPRLDGVSAAESLPAGVQLAIDRLAAGYGGRAAMAVRKLGVEIPQREVDE